MIKTFSLRRTVLIWMTVLLAGVGAAAMMLAYWLTSQEAAEFLDGQLRQVALNAGTAVIGAEAPPASDSDPEDQIAVTVWQQGSLVRSELPGAAVALPIRPGYADIVVAGEFWRAYTIANKVWTVQAVQRESVRQEYARSAAMGAAAPILIVIPLSWIILGWTIRRTFARLDAVAREIAMQSVAAAGPIAPDRIPTELAPLVDSINGLIAQLRAALEAQQRFLADAAHELRTPLAAMQIQVDNLALAEPAASEARQAIARGVKRAGDLVGQLLQLARLDDPLPSRGTLVDLAALVLECAADQAPLADRKEIELGVKIEAPFEVTGIGSELRVLIGNLVENAVRYTPSGGRVDVRLGRTAGESTFEVIDTGPGLPPGSEARIFDRFYRAAPADVEGTGLGLAIAVRIAERHGLRLTVENRPAPATGVTARVHLPA